MHHITVIHEKWVTTSTNSCFNLFKGFLAFTWCRWNFSHRPTCIAVFYTSANLICLYKYYDWIRVYGSHSRNFADRFPMFESIFESTIKIGNIMPSSTHFHKKTIHVINRHTINIIQKKLFKNSKFNPNLAGCVLNFETPNLSVRFNMRFNGRY